MLLKEEINKNPISEPAELFVTPTTVQWLAVVSPEDYHLKCCIRRLYRTKQKFDLTQACSYEFLENKKYGKLIISKQKSAMVLISIIKNGG